MSRSLKSINIYWWSHRHSLTGTWSADIYWLPGMCKALWGIQSHHYLRSSQAHCSDKPQPHAAAGAEWGPPLGGTDPAQAVGICTNDLAGESWCHNVHAEHICPARRGQASWSGREGCPDGKHETGSQKPDLGLDFILTQALSSWVIQACHLISLAIAFIPYMKWDYVFSCWAHRDHLLSAACLARCLPRQA